MPPTLLSSSRDRDVLRSFARRIDRGDAGAHNNLGVLYFRKGMSEDAVASFTRALELDPRMTVAQKNLEIAYFNTGYYDARVAELRDRLQERGDDREARWELGRTYALLGKIADAIGEFTTLLRDDPDDGRAMVQLALAEQRGGNMESASRWLQLALDRDPGHAALHYHLGEVAYHRGLNAEALAALQRSIAIKPDEADAHYLLAFVLGDMGRHDEAREATRHAMRLNPALGKAQANLSLERGDTKATGPNGHAVPSRNGELGIVAGGQLAHYGLGLAFRQKGYLAEALREYRLALDRGEDRGLVQQAMAEVHLLRKESVAAVQLYDRLLEDQPHSPKLWNERGIALHQDGRYVDAAGSYTRALEADPRYALALNNLGVAWFHAGKGERAIDAFRQALREQPTFVKARLNLALLLFKHHEYPLCLDAYRQVLSIEPEQAVAWNGIGLVLVQLRKLEDARNAFARAVDARPEYAEARYNLSFALSNLGDFAGALRETKAALELDPFYVPQKFELAIDLEFEDPRIEVNPDLGGDRRDGDSVADFAFDPRAVERLFDELAPATVTPRKTAPGGDPYAWAVTLAAKGDLERAVTETTRSMTAGASALTGLVLLGDLFVRQGAYGEALDRYRQARLLAPESLPAAQGELRALVELGRSAEAGSAADWLAANGSTNVDALLLVARVRAETGVYEGALQSLEEARRLAPVRAEVQKQIGDVARAMDETERALEAYRHAVALDGDYAAARYDLATLLAANGASDDAERELLAALESVPTFTEAILALASLRRARGRADETIELLVILLQRDPYHLDALASLGESLFLSNRRDDASVAFARVLRFDPEHVVALYFDGVLLAERHRYREAIERWKRVVDLEPAGETARRARRDTRTALDLQRIFSARERRGAA